MTNVTGVPVADLDAFEVLYLDARADGLDVDLQFSKPAPPAAAAPPTFLTGTDLAAARVRPVETAPPLPKRVGAAFAPPLEETPKTAHVLVRNTTDKTLVLACSKRGGRLETRKCLRPHDATLCDASTDEHWLLTFEDDDDDDVSAPALALRVGPHCVLGTTGYSLAWQSTEHALSFVPQARIHRQADRKMRRDYASDGAMARVRAMDVVSESRRGADGHANCAITVL